MCFPSQQPDVHNHDAISSELKTRAKATLSCLLLISRVHYGFLSSQAHCLLDHYFSCYMLTEKAIEVVLRYIYLTTSSFSRSLSRSRWLAFDPIITSYLFGPCLLRDATLSCG